jgi:hypothetical protein
VIRIEEENEAGHEEEHEEEPVGQKVSLSSIVRLVFVVEAVKDFLL